jgi:hypothetical protein
MESDPHGNSFVCELGKKQGLTPAFCQLLSTGNRNERNITRDIHKPFNMCLYRDK